MTVRRIAIEVDTDVVTARAVARAAYALIHLVDTEDGSVTVDGFAMNPTDGWNGNYRISIESAD